MLLGLLDDKDKAILELLLQDSRASTKSISERLSIPRVTVHDRIKRLQDKVDEYEDVLNHFQRFRGSKATHLKSSNLNDELYTD